jgi:2-C-methyl-D-erythritol 4-phosphate cytidylyltransferase
MHTLAALAPVSRIDATFIVVAPTDTFFDAHPGPWRVLPCGGHTRASSVIQGLQALRGLGAADQDWVLVHDAARCLVQAQQIDALLDACLDDPVGGLLAVPLADTLKVAQDGRAVSTVARSDKWQAQTPQMFRLGPLLQALQAAGDAVTDEASAMELQGLHPRLVAASGHNFKVTYPEDFALAQAVLEARR